MTTAACLNVDAVDANASDCVAGGRALGAERVEPKEGEHHRRLARAGAAWERGEGQRGRARTKFPR